ncbi:hypothetical protein [Dysgonomonas sp. 520]|uniref:hypothetical protein n=1 Tax=Dysgonomonas sp. 520 TaxID=2302931 RepID=UPI0013D1957A|nr:hypothetical protein [Dysgonomonas sp. 520]
MLVNDSINSSTSNVPAFTPSVKLENIYENILVENIPIFLQDISNGVFTRNLNEEGFTQEFTSVLNRSLINHSRGVLVVPEFKDYYSGGNPAKRVDFVFISSEQNVSKKSLYAVEAKRLPTGKGTREIEYVIGYCDSGNPSGGIQRFKTSDHGYGLSKSALLGYIEQDDFLHWHNTINGWILSKATELPQEWKSCECLSDLEIEPNKTYSISRSTAKRISDDIDLLHLWVKVP